MLIKVSHQGISTKQVNQWKTIICLQGILISFFFSYLIFQTWSLFNSSHLISFLLLPLAMLLITPISARFKRKFTNHNIIKITSCLLWLFVTLILLLPLLPFKGIFVVYCIVLFLLGASVAGMVPFTIEIVRSYYQSQNFEKKFSPHIYMFWGAIIIPIVFLLKYILLSELSNIIILAIISFVTLSHTLLILSAKNIQISEVTFTIGENSWQNLKKNKNFWYYLSFTSWQNNIYELCGYLLPIILFLNEPDIILVLLIIYLTRSIGVFLGNNIGLNLSKKTSVFINQMVFIIGLILMVIFLFCYYWYASFTWKILYLVFGILVTQFVWGLVIGFHKKSQTKILRENNIISNNMNLALMFIHVCGRAVGTLILGLISFLIIINTNFSVYSITLLFFVFLILSCLILFAGIFLKKSSSNLK